MEPHSDLHYHENFKIVPLFDTDYGESLRVQLLLLYVNWTETSEYIDLRFYVVLVFDSASVPIVFQMYSV